MQEHGLITALGFHPDEQRLLAATSSNYIALFNVVTVELASWSEEHGKQLPGRLERMPGHIIGITFNPAPKVSGAVVTL